jgi:hypothetical protein
MIIVLNSLNFFLAFLLLTAHLIFDLSIPIFFRSWIDLIQQYLADGF